MIQIPNLPPKGEFDYKIQQFLQGTYDQFIRSNPFLFYLLLGVIVSAIPLTFVIRSQVAAILIGSYKPPIVNTVPYVPVDLKVGEVKIIPVNADAISVYVQIVNPNPELAVRVVDYKFVLEGKDSHVLSEIPGRSYIYQGESKSFVLPTAPAKDITRVRLEIMNVKWTKQRMSPEVRFAILQKNVGVTAEGLLFVEGQLKNLQGFTVRNTELTVLLHDRSNQKILAINATVLNDILPFETRYFRVIWHGANRAIANSLGIVEVLPYVNTFEPNVLFQSGDEPVPIR